jgi:hypothetical protein
MEENAELPVCLKCFQPNTPDKHFCVHCNAPLTTFATTAPYEHILAGGFAVRTASNAPTKPIILIGMWLLFGPAFLVLVALDL